MSMSIGTWGRLCFAAWATACTVDAVDPGTGLSQAGEGGLAVDPAKVPVLGMCAAGEWVQRGPGNTWNCVAVPPGGIGTVSAGEGLKGGGSGASVSLGVDFAQVARADHAHDFMTLTGIPDASATGARCELPDQRVVGINVSTGAVTCEADPASPWTQATGGIAYASGNVGIGTAMPETQLHLSSGGMPELRVTQTGGPVVGRLLATTSDVELIAESAHPLLLATDGEERLRITATGDVGVGLTQPGAKLDVAGGYVRSDSGFCIAQSCVTAWPSGQGPWAVNGADLYYTGGFVGIGRTPTVPLDVRIEDDMTADIAAVAMFTHTSRGAPLAGIGVAVDLGVKRSIDGQPASAGRIQARRESSTTENSSLDFRVVTGSQFLTALTLDSDGDVGLGTTGPSHKLEVHGPGEVVRLHSTESDAPYDGLWLRPPVWDDPRGKTKQAYIAAQNNIGLDLMTFTTAGLGPNPRISLTSRSGVQFSFSNGNASNPYTASEWVERLRIDTNGYLGIGTVEPTAPLTVDRSISGNNVVSIHQSHVGGDGTYIRSAASAATRYLLAVDGNDGVTNALWVRANGKVGVGTADPQFSLHVNGDAAKPGGGSWTDSSDARLKENVRPLGSTLERLLGLRGVTYEWKDPHAHGDLAGPQIGMIAQEVEKVFPGWVGTDARGMKTLTFRGFEALTVEALRELRAENQRLARENEELRGSLKDLDLRLRRLEPRPHAAIGNKTPWTWAFFGVALVVALPLWRRRRPR